MENRRFPETGARGRTDADCRTLDLGIEGFVECLRAGPNSCKHAMPFGYAFLCRHPRYCAEAVAGERRAVTKASPHRK
jgi:hypothetical protein